MQTIVYPEIKNGQLRINETIYFFNLNFPYLSYENVSTTRAPMCMSTKYIIYSDTIPMTCDATFKRSVTCTNVT